MTRLDSARRTSTPLRHRFSFGWSFLLLITLLVTVSRGFFELFLPKSAAYGVQLAVGIVFVLLLLAFGGPTARVGTRWIIISASILFFAALIALWIAVAVENATYAFTYVGVTLFFAALLVVFACLRFRVAKRINFALALTLTGLAMLAVALAQQFAGLTLFGGSDRGTFGSIVRPAAMTASFLHYPLAAAIIGFVLIGVAVQRARHQYTVVGVVILGGVALSLSRSGLVILLVAGIAGLLMSRTIAAGIRNTLALGLVILAATFLLPNDLILNRIGSIFNTDSGGNQTRIAVWTNVVDLWMASPLLVGSHPGEFSNVTSNLTDTQVTVAESGVLQLLISYGLIGLIAYYLLMFGTVRASPSSPTWFRAVAIGCIAQSAVYQSIEVFPFMLMFAMIPFFADGITRTELEGDDRSSRALRGPMSHRALIRRSS